MPRPTPPALHALHADAATLRREAPATRISTVDTTAAGEALVQFHRLAGSASIASVTLREQAAAWRAYQAPEAS
jgi:hypothetical protein